MIYKKELFREGEKLRPVYNNNIKDLPKVNEKDPQLVGTLVVVTCYEQPTKLIKNMKIKVAFMPESIVFFSIHVTLGSVQLNVKPFRV